jgi:hypothetical protein
MNISYGDGGVEKLALYQTALPWKRDICCMLETEWAYYLKNQAQWSNDHHGKEVLIVGEKAMGFYNSIEEAYWAALDKHELGTFLIQTCLPGKEAYTLTLRSRV